MHHFNGQNQDIPHSLVALGCAIVYHHLSPHILLTTLNIEYRPNTGIVVNECRNKTMFG